MADMFDEDPFAEAEEHSPVEPALEDAEVTTEEDEELVTNEEGEQFGSDAPDMPSQSPDDAELQEEEEGADDLIDNDVSANEVVFEDDSVLSKWEEERKEVLRKRREGFIEAQKVTVEEASREMEAFLQEYKESTASRQKKNRDEEQENVADLASVMEHGTLWEKVGRLVDLSPGNAAFGGKDMTRMRSLLIQLKNEH